MEHGENYERVRRGIVAKARSAARNGAPCNSGYSRSDYKSLWEYIFNNERNSMAAGLPSFCNKCGAPATSFPKSGPKCRKCLGIIEPPKKKKWKK